MTSSSFYIPILNYHNSNQTRHLKHLIEGNAPLKRRWKMHILGIFFYNYDFKKCEIKYLIQRNKRGDDDKRTLNEMFKFLFTIILFANLKI